MREPLLSVCLITYNHYNYIKDAIEGILMQQVDFTWELIIADDYSTDGTREILIEYKQKHPSFIKLILQEKNVGPAKNWEDLIQYPKSKYIAYIEGDDFWINPLKLQKQVDFLETNNEYSMCFHNAIKYYDGIHKKVGLFNNLNKDNDLSLHNAVHDWVIPSASIVGRTEIMQTYPSWLCRIYSGDYSLILILFYFGKIRYINKIMSFYRIVTTGSSITALMSTKNIFMIEQKILLLESYNKGTNYIFSNEINSRVRYLKLEKRFQKAKINHNIIVMLLMPNLLIKKIKRKLFLEKN